MSGLSVKEINLKEFPKEILQFDPKADITIGDAHANVINIIHKLIMYGVVEMSEHNYLHLVKIYEKDVEDLTKEDIESFNDIIDKLDVNNPSVIRWIGDTLADRGKNDYFVLKLLEKLKKTCNVEILISNHDGQFLDAYRAGATKAPGLYEIDSISLVNLGKLIEKGLVTGAEVNRLVEDVYKPSLRAISYTIDNDTQPPGITIFTHAPVGFETFEAAAKFFNIPYKDGTIVELTNTIDLINEAFLAGPVLYSDLRANHEKYQNVATMGGISIPVEFPLLRLMWNRGNKKSDLVEGFSGDIGKDEFRHIVIPENKPYRITLVHGHEGESRGFLYRDDLPPGASHKPNMFNLDDSSVGKRELDSGKSLVFVTQESPAPKIKYETISLQRECTIAANARREEKESLEASDSDSGILKKIGVSEFKGNLWKRIGQALVGGDYRTATSKIAAIEKLHSSLQGKKVEYTETDVLALRDSTTKHLLAKVEKANQIPKELAEAERKYDSGSDYRPRV